MASLDRKTFLSLPSGSSYLEISSMSNAYSLYPGPSIDIFCAKTLVALYVSSIHDVWPQRTHFFG
jgi:hypothetical protein